MKTYRIETYVVDESSRSFRMRGHVSGKEVLDFLKEERKKFPELRLRGRAAHLEKDGNDSLKNFSWNESGEEINVDFT